MTIKNLLVELLVEELPPKALKKLGEAFADGVFSGLEINDFLEPTSVKTGFVTPRRLAVHITDVRPVSQPRSRPPKPLMPLAVGLDSEGRPTASLIKKLRSIYHDDVDIDWLMNERVFLAEEGGKQVLKHREDLASGSQLFIRLEGAIDEALTKLPIPKTMTYQLADGWSDEKFVRPAHGLVVLHGSDPIELPTRVLGLTAGGRETLGHRFEAKASVISIKDADSYAQQLREEGAVIASFAERRAEIERQLEAAATKEGLKPICDDALLDEVTALVELPNVLTGKFDKAFLEVPPECLILTMKSNQKYFPLLDVSGKLTNKFLIVSNINPTDPSAVIGGNERVVRPRLADAKFFFDQDRKKTLESRLPGLAKVVYHNKLGSQGERVERVRAIARWVAEKVNADVQLADRAAKLAKADLLTDMVGEFPELQGIMGGYYARHDGEDEAVAQAIADQYLLRRDETDDVSNLVSEVLQIADRMETLVGIWGIGLKPTGDKDPFALRRHALSIIKSFQLLGAAYALDKAKLPLDIDELIKYGLSVFPSGMLGENVAEELRLFIYERNANQLTGFFGAETIAAVFASMPPLHEIVKRLRAVREFATLPESPSLATANKRVGNILRKAEGEVGSVADPARFIEAEEKALFAALSDIAPRADAAFESGDYTASLQVLAALKAPVDAFFDQVMVNADDPALRANRLALLNQLHQTMNRVADISRLAA